MATAIAPPRPPKRNELPADANLCDHCTARCCKYFALPIEEPKDEEDFQYMRWYLMHEAATVFTEDDTWYLLVHTTCKHLLPDNRCGTYDTRPQICRDYSTENCEYGDEYVYDRYFETSEQVQEYADAMFARQGRVKRTARPPLLQVLAAG